MAAPKSGVCLITRCDPCVHLWSLGVHFAVCTMCLSVHRVVWCAQCHVYGKVCNFTHISVLYGCIQWSACASKHTVQCAPMMSKCTLCSVQCIAHCALWMHQWSACVPLLGVQCAPMMSISVHFVVCTYDAQVYTLYIVCTIDAPMVGVCPITRCAVCTYDVY